jgi:DNA-binding response OmpR family regulator
MKKILVVEDSATMRLLIRMHLKNFSDVMVIEARDGVEALEKIRETGCDLVITDINMPRMDGLKLTETLRIMGLYVPIIMLTTRGEEGDREKGLLLGASDYVTKPIAGPHLSYVVTNYIKEADMGIGADQLSAYEK